MSGAIDRTSYLLPTNDVCEEFRRELQALVNRYSLENMCNTPDFILAAVMSSALWSFAEAVRRRDAWYDAG